MKARPMCLRTTVKSLLRMTNNAYKRYYIAGMCCIIASLALLLKFNSYLADREKHKTKYKCHPTHNLQYMEVQSRNLYSDHFSVSNMYRGSVERIENYTKSNKQYRHSEAQHHLSKQTLQDNFKLYTSLDDIYERHVFSVDCDKIINGDECELAKAETIMGFDIKKEITAKQYIDMASNYSSFIAAIHYITSPLTEDEANYSIAFSILMYKSVEQAECLLRAIYIPHNYYCIHFDKKSGIHINDAMTAIAACFSNVFISRIQVNVTWSTISVLEPELQCIDELWNRSSKWKYFINLTGQEFSLRTNYELVQILHAYNGANDVNGTIQWEEEVDKSSIFISYQHNFEAIPIFKTADKHNHYERTGKQGKMANAGPPPHGINPTKGSVHIVISRGFVDFVLHDRRAGDFLNWTSRTIIPEETYFSTLNHNPLLGVPGSYNGTPEGDATYRKIFLARFKQWGPPQGSYLCHGKYVRDICIFGVRDLQVFSHVMHLFVNKFHVDYERLALDCLEEIHYNRIRDEYIGAIMFNSSVYSMLGFVKDKIDGANLK